MNRLSLIDDDSVIDIWMAASTKEDGQYREEIYPLRLKDEIRRIVYMSV